MNGPVERKGEDFTFDRRSHFTSRIETFDELAPAETV
jgi:hypothetical protein